MTNNDGLLIVLSGPSGVGKGTMKHKLLADRDDIVESISVTTRAPREGEKEGESYFFKTSEAFNEMIENNLFLEYCGVFGRQYGTPKEYVMKNLKEGKDVLLEIDVQGGLKVKGSYRDAVLILVLPPRLDELVHRLEVRGTETPEEVARRYAMAKDEILQFVNYDYVVVNDNLEDACDRVREIIRVEKLHAKRALPRVQAIIEKN